MKEETKKRRREDKEYDKLFYRIVRISTYLFFLLFTCLRSLAYSLILFLSLYFLLSPPSPPPRPCPWVGRGSVLLCGNYIGAPDDFGCPCRKREREGGGGKKWGRGEGIRDKCVWERDGSMYAWYLFFFLKFVPFLSLFHDSLSSLPFSFFPLFLHYSSPLSSSRLWRRRSR